MYSEDSKLGVRLWLRHEANDQAPPADFLQCLQPWVRTANFYFRDLPTSEADDLGKLLLAETYASAEVTYCVREMQAAAPQSCRVRHRLR